MLSRWTNFANADGEKEWRTEMLNLKMILKQDKNLQTSEMKDGCVYPMQ